MPYKYAKKKGLEVPKQKYKITNWSEYNAALRARGAIDVWISEDAITKWYEADRVYDGTGAPKLYSDFAIMTCHELRLVYRLPLRQCQGFIDSIFKQMGIDLICPDYSVLCVRLKELGIKTKKYRLNRDKADNSVHTIAIDSTGLKRFGRGEWHQEKYELSRKASWRKLHVAVNEDHVIEGCSLTDRFSHDNQEVSFLLDQVDKPIDEMTADGAYDETAVYEQIIEHSPLADVVIPPRENAVVSAESHFMRNRNILEIKQFGRMAWQRIRNYGRRNYAELAILRYKRLVGAAMRARDFLRQKKEAILGCNILNKMTSLGMPRSYRSA